MEDEEKISEYFFLYKIFSKIMLNSILFFFFFIEINLILDLKMQLTKAL